jgi:hypothetical protein
MPMKPEWTDQPFTDEMLTLDWRAHGLASGS